MNIYEISCEMQRIYDRLESGDGIDKETGEILPEIMDAIALNQQNLQEKAIDYGYVIKSFDDNEAVLDREIKRLTARKRSIANARERLANNLQSAMEQFGIEKIEGKTVTISLRNSSFIQIDDIDEIPEKYKNTETVVKIDKTAIKSAIKSGEEVAGARVEQRKNLSIR
jgi:hypothetical protein